MDPRRPRLQTLGADLTAGVTVALVGLPQCLAYAMMSGLPPAYGLTTAAVPGVIAALAGRSAQVVTGPTNTTGLLILAALAPYLGPDGFLGAEGLPTLATLTLLAGLIRLLAARVGAASLIRFLPESFLVGFTAGAGILIATMQLDEALGLDPIRGAGLVEEVVGLGEALSRSAPSWPASLVAFGTAAVVLMGMKRNPHVPVALLTVIATTIVVMLTGADASSGLPLVSDRAPLPSGWPPGALPDVHPSTLARLLAPAAAIALLGTLELTVSASAAGGRPDLRREIQAQGWANLAGAFSSAFPASASLTRSALLRLGGARTRLAAASGAVFVVPLLLFAGPVVESIPQASLAGVLFATAWSMVDVRRMSRAVNVWRSPRAVMLTSLLATLVLPLELAVFAGTGLALVLHLAEDSHPHLRAWAVQRGSLAHLEGTPAAVAIEVSGNLHFAAASTLPDAVFALVPASARDVIIDLTHAHAIRWRAVDALEEIDAALGRRGARLHICGAPDRLLHALEREGRPLSATGQSELPGAALQECIVAVSRLSQNDAPTDATS
ncbi:MAG: putative sulfate transporter [Myxococcales bacterium]